LKKNSYIIYKHTFPNNKIYIGKTCQKPTVRWGKNGVGYIHNHEMYEDIKKYGWENIYHEILFHDLSKEEASQIEYELIEKNKGNCYNKILGGDGYFLIVNGEKMYLNDIANNKEMNPLGLTKNEIRNRIFNHVNARNFDLERALLQPKGVKDQPYKNLYKYKDKEYNLKELSELSPWNLTPNQLRDRIEHRKFSVERAVEQKPRKSRNK
jgi:hypothetical protein